MRSVGEAGAFGIPLRTERRGDAKQRSNALYSTISSPLLEEQLVAPFKVDYADTVERARARLVSDWDGRTLRAQARITLSSG